MFGMLAMLLVAVPVKAGSQVLPQQTFASPEAARQALIDTARTHDLARMERLFGPLAREMEPGDPVELQSEFAEFTEHVLERADLLPEGEGRVIIVIGAEKWPFPIPLVRTGTSWLFDTRLGREALLEQRIGQNELSAIRVCRTYVQAQAAYYALPEPDGDQVPKYAQHFVSQAGRRDGLYWPVAAGAPPSPLGSLVAGYLLQPRQPGETGRRPFHGYSFKVLLGQGPHAPGGEYSYTINGNMVAGHALVAYPVKWGVSGVMTFIVNQRGRVYQKNLGAQTPELADKMLSYDPDATWKLVEPYYLEQ
jgi:hypothetical protein